MVFLVNLPLGAAIVWLGVRGLREREQLDGRLPDLPGAALLAASLAALIYDGFLRYRLGVRQRLKAIVGDDESSSVSLFKDLRRFDRTDEGETRSAPYASRHA